MRKKPFQSTWKGKSVTFRKLLDNSRRSITEGGFPFITTEASLHFHSKKLVNIFFNLDVPLFAQKDRHFYLVPSNLFSATKLSSHINQQQTSPAFDPLLLKVSKKT